MDIIDTVLSKIFGTRKIMKDSTLVIIATSFSSLMTFLTNLFWGRYLGPESYGSLKTIIYLTGLFSSLINLGLVFTATKYIAEFRGRDKKKIGPLVRWIFKFRIIAYIISMLLFVLFIKDITLFFLHDISLSYLMIPALFVIFTNFFGILPFMIQGFENFKLFFSSKIIFGLLYLSLGFGFLKFGVNYSLFGIGLAFLISNLICLKFLIKNNAFEKTKIKVDFKKIFLKFSLPLYISNIPNYLGNSIVVILSIFFPMEVVGYFSFSFIFYFAALLIPMALTGIVLPRVSNLNGLKKHNDAKKVLMKVFAIYTPMMILGIIGTLIFSKFILSLIAPQFLPGLIFFKVLLCFGFIIGYLVIYTSYLTAKEKMKQVAVFILLQNLVLFILSFIMLKVLI